MKVLCSQPHLLTKLNITEMGTAAEFSNHSGLNKDYDTEPILSTVSDHLSEVDEAESDKKNGYESEEFLESKESGSQHQDFILYRAVSNTELPRDVSQENLVDVEVASEVASEEDENEQEEDTLESEVISFRPFLGNHMRLYQQQDLYPPFPHLISFLCPSLCFYSILFYFYFYFYLFPLLTCEICS